MNANNVSSSGKQPATLRALVNGLCATSPGFLRWQLPAQRGALPRQPVVAVWEPSLPLLSPVWGSCVHRCAGSASAFTTKKEMPIREEPLGLCLSAHILSGGCWLLAVHPFPNDSALSRAPEVKIKLISQFLFYGFVKDFSSLQILFKIPFQLWFISSPFLPQYFRSGLNLRSLTSLHTFCIVLDRLRCMAGILFLKAADCDTIAKRKTFVKVPLVMHSYHLLKRFN